MNEQDIELVVNHFFSSRRDDQLKKFAIQSNEIEGIYDEDRHLIHFDCLRNFLCLDKIDICDLEMFVSRIEPGAFLRSDPEHIVYIGGNKACDSSLISSKLEKVLYQVNHDMVSPFISHQEYEFIHPFIDGNGRSGRALWLWQMVKHHRYNLNYLFLQMYYYQSFDACKNFYE